MPTKTPKKRARTQNEQTSALQASRAGMIRRAIRYAKESGATGKSFVLVRTAGGILIHVCELRELSGVVASAHTQTRNRKRPSRKRTQGKRSNG